jgi:hypothetical protein
MRGPRPQRAVEPLKKKLSLPIPVAVRSKAWVYGRSLARIVGLNPAEGMDVYLL